MRVGQPGEDAIPIVDPRVDVERLVLLRDDLRRVQRLARALTADQQLVLREQLQCGERYRAGVRPIEEIRRQNPVAQSYLQWGLPGPGRWVSIYAATTPSDHVFAVIAGLRLDTSHNSTDVGPSRNEDGPRWRILDHIPTWARWSVRHPPGL